MKTKFTKGKWLLETNSESASFINTSTHRIAEAKHYSTIIDDVLLEPTVEKGRANALLISKAPEMFEMLETTSKALRMLNTKGTNELAEEIEQLLKEATEL